MENRLKVILSKFEGKEEELIPILQETQAEFGYLLEEALLDIARFVGVPESKVYAVATFYAQFRFTPIGRNKVTLCRGTACHVKGAPRILDEIERHLGIKEGDTTPDMEYSLETVACIGTCGLAPTLVINNKTYGRLSVKGITKIFNNIRLKENGEKNGKQQ